MNLESLYQLIRKFEGLRLRRYKCPAGVWTCGYGSTGADVNENTPDWTAAYAETRMEGDADLFLRVAIKLSPILALYPDKLAAIADFCYNLGSTRYKASTLKRCVDQGDWNGASEQLGKWVWGGGRKLPGLIARRQAEAELLTSS